MMRTKNAKPISRTESAHLAAVKSLACSVCDTAGPGEAHHTEQGNHFTTVALCMDCHRGSVNGWHGQKRMWLVRKFNENDALNITIARLQHQRSIV